jgi:hypothetical protein
MPRKPREAKLAKADRVLAAHVTAHLVGARMVGAHVSGVPIPPEQIQSELDVASNIAVQLIRAVDRRLNNEDRHNVRVHGTVDYKHGGRH